MKIARGLGVNAGLGLPEKDANAIRERYNSFFAEHGPSAAGAGWGEKDRQLLRYKDLFRALDLRGKSVLDVGGGFGDGFKVARSLGVDSYTVVDLSRKHVDHANRALASNIGFRAVSADFLAWDVDRNYDVVIASGLFNFRLEELDNLEFIKGVLGKSISIAEEIVCTNFLSEHADLPEDHLYYTSLSDLIPIVRSFSNRYSMSYDFLPFEFTLRVLPPRPVKSEVGEFG